MLAVFPIVLNYLFTSLLSDSARVIVVTVLVVPEKLLRRETMESAAQESLTDQKLLVCCIRCTVNFAFFY